MMRPIWCSGWRLPLAAGALALVSVPLWAGEPKSPAVFDEDMSGYAKTAPSGVVAALENKISKGDTTLKRTANDGFLDSLLRQLNIPSASQLLVASKTSPNKDFISPQNPRALYFNESVSVAYVPGAPLIEIAVTDPKLGLVFYTVDQKSESPHFKRDDRCLECHASAKTLDVPGMLTRSFLTKADGEVDLLSGLMVNHRTPVSNRWGGYYVTGTHGNQSHRGNVFGVEAVARHEREPLSNGNVTNLASFLSTARYAGQGSDIVALMVLDHQAHMQNLFTRIAYTARTSPDIQTAYPQIEAALRYLLFAEEVRLISPVQGTSDFAREFARQPPKDATGRSLRDFDLQTRLFKYPCSYMIYSSSFDAMPAAAKSHFYRRLWRILSGDDKSAEYNHLTPEMRRSIREILVATKKDLPVYWDL